MDNKEFLVKFVTERKIDDERESCLMIALQTARVLFGKEKDNKCYNIDYLEKLNGIIDYLPFIGLVNYLLILDMIGCIFTQKKQFWERIDEVLRLFGHIKYPMDRKIIRILRNTLTHNYGLADKEKKCKFILNNSCADMIKPSDKAWDGKFSSKNDNATSITINPSKLIDKIEEIYEEVRTQVFNGTLDSPLSREELETRFTIIIE